MRILLDANVIVSALISPSSPSARLLAAASVGRLDLLVPKRLVAEVRGVLSRPKIRRRLRPDAWPPLQSLLQHLEAAQGPAAPQRFPFPADPEDAYLLDSAFEHQPTLLITGDGALLKIIGTDYHASDGSTTVFHVLSPTEACAVLKV